MTVVRAASSGPPRRSRTGALRAGTFAAPGSRDLSVPGGGAHLPHRYNGFTALLLRDFLRVAVLSRC